MTRRETIEGLKYIAESPGQENGGFHPQTIVIAMAALDILQSTCTWRDDTGEGNYATECGDCFCVIEETLHKNGMRFCPYCGRRIKTVRKK